MYSCFSCWEQRNHVHCDQCLQLLNWLAPIERENTLGRVKAEIGVSHSMIKGVPPLFHPILGTSASPLLPFLYWDVDQVRAVWGKGLCCELVELG